MSNLIRYQVFVSSTFTDLRDERAEVLQAIWELDCIPTGMEAFVATNEAQWEVIQKVIDECDYYVLIVGGRYGSVTAEGISYTEKEYNYAKKLKIPVLAFVHGDPENIPVSKTEKEENGRKRLETFRNRVMAEHPVRKWLNAAELGGVVSRSISRAIKVSPRPGWVRNTGPSNLELLERINLLTKENQELLEKANSASSLDFSVEELASGEDLFEIYSLLQVRDQKPPYSASTITTVTEVSWDDIFRSLGPLMMNEATENQLIKGLDRFIEVPPEVKNNTVIGRNISTDSFGNIKIQLRALGLIDKGSRRRAPSDRSNYWALTEKGERYLVVLLAQKKGREPEAMKYLQSDDEDPLGSED